MKGNKNINKKILNSVSRFTSRHDIMNTSKKEFINQNSRLEPVAVELLKNDYLIKTKFSFDLDLYYLINTTTSIYRAFRVVRTTNLFGCFENVKSAD